ncbi:hypothetical protein ABPG72_007158 [Tetrahymena utriculariae]
MSQANKLQKSQPVQIQQHLNGNHAKQSLSSVMSQQQQQKISAQEQSLKNEDQAMHRTQMKANTIDILSPVLLVIFNTNEAKTNQDLFDMFSHYVRVIRVLIFERKENNTKCFVEMMTQEEATYVKNQISFQKTKNLLKNLQVYYAQIQTIDLQNHYSEGQDFTSYYATHPNFTCQYIQESQQYTQNLQNSTINPKQSSQAAFQNSFLNPGKSNVQQSINSPITFYNNFNPNNQSFAAPVNNKTSTFGAPYVNSQQFLPNHVPTEMDNNYDQSHFLDGQIRPSSISSIDYQMQSNLHLSQYNHTSIHPHSQYTTNGGNSCNLTSRHTIHGNPNMQPSNTPLESKIYYKTQQPQQQQSLSQRSPISQQLYRDLQKKEQVLSHHINQNMQQNMQKSALLLSPYFNVTPGVNKLEMINNPPPISLNSSTNRSPSSTSYSINNNNLNNGNQIQYDSDVDENVQASQPSTFTTKYRDVQFFNGNSNNVGYLEDIDPQQQQMGADQEAKKVLFVRHLDFPDLKISMLYNLFSNYGNIVKIIFMKQKRQALIEFEETSQATAAKENLNNLSYYNAQIKIDYSKYDQIDLQKKKLHSGENNEQEQVLQIPHQCFRYKNTKGIPQYAPKNTLHVSNIKKEFFDYNLIYEFFSSSGAKIKMLKLIPNEKKQMCLIQFETLDDALRVISTFHDTPFHGRNLCISFTKSANQIQQPPGQSNNISTNFSSSNNISSTVEQQQQSLMKQQQQMQNQQYNINILSQNQLFIQQQQYQSAQYSQNNTFQMNNFAHNNNNSHGLAAQQPTLFGYDLSDNNYHQYYDTYDDSDEDPQVTNSIQNLGI